MKPLVLNVFTKAQNVYPAAVSIVYRLFIRWSDKLSGPTQLPSIYPATYEQTYQL